jgi:hypothetical protein
VSGLSLRFKQATRGKGRVDERLCDLHAGPLALVGRGLHSAPSRLAHHSVLFIFLALSQLNYHAIGQAIGWIHDNAVVLGKTIHDFKF